MSRTRSPSPTPMTTTQNHQTSHHQNPNHHQNQRYDDLVNNITFMRANPESHTQAATMLASHLALTYRNNPRLAPHHIMQELTTITNNDQNIIRMAYDVFSDKHPLPADIKREWTATLQYHTHNTSYTDPHHIKGHYLRPSIARLIQQLPLQDRIQLLN